MAEEAATVSALPDEVAVSGAVTPGMAAGDIDRAMATSVVAIRTLAASIPTATATARSRTGSLGGLGPPKWWRRGAVWFGASALGPDGRVVSRRRIKTSTGADESGPECRGRPEPIWGMVVPGG
jgi:hypothetical protein